MSITELRDAVRLVSITNPSELVKFTEKGRKKVLPE